MLVCSHIIYNVYLAIVPEGEGAVRAREAAGQVRECRVERAAGGVALQGLQGASICQRPWRRRRLPASAGV